MKQFNTEHINSIRNDLRTWFGNEWADSFDKSKDKARWFRDNQEALLTNDQFVRKYDIDALQGVSSKPMESIYNRYPDYSKLTENQIKRFESASNQSREELKKYYKFREDQKNEVKKFNDERYKELETARQESERAKGGYYNSPIANEYARKMNIKGASDEDVLRQEMVGKSAAFADFLPLPASLLGPVLRIWQKDKAGEPILTKGTATDIAGAVIPDLVEKPAKLAWQYLKNGKFGKILESKTGKQIENRINAADDVAAKQAAKDIELTTNTNLDDLDTKQLIDLYREVKNPEIKKSIEDYWVARNAKEESSNLRETAYEIANKSETMVPAERKKALLEADIAMALADKELEKKGLVDTERKFDYAKEFYKPTLEVKSGYLQKEQPLMVNGNLNTYYKDVPLKYINDYIDKQVEPNKFNDLLYNMLRMGGYKAAHSTLGGHKWNEINYKPNYSEDKALNEIISMYSNEWKYGRPANYDEPLIKAAYDKWLKDQYRKGNYDVLYRMGEIE